jgi:arsenical pump membrane protein
MIALAIFIVTLALVLWRPRGIGIGWIALAGAAASLAAGTVHLSDIPEVWALTWDATFTFVALIILSLVLDEAGFFEWAALHVVRWAGGSGVRLFPLIVLLGAAMSAVFANDGAILLLTPIVVAILRQLELDERAVLAFVLASGFVADSTSLPLVISNLVNILSANFFHLAFDRYALVMIPVDLAALAASLAMLFLVERRAIPARYATDHLPPPASAIADPLVFRASFPLLALLLLAYFALGQRGVPVSAVTSAAALILLGLAGRWHRLGRGRLVSVTRPLIAAPWQIVIFSLGMYLVVYGLREAGLMTALAQGLFWLSRQGGLATTLGAGFGAALLSSAMNNLPATLTGALAIGQSAHISAAAREAAVYANIIGCDLGPKFTPVGSLATLLWMHVLDRKGIHVGWADYMRFGLLVTPPVLLATLLALHVWLRLLG